MDAASRLLSRVLPAVLARAPLTPEKIEFAWRTVVGAAMAKATRVELGPGATLIVHATEPNWRREVKSASPVILPRLIELLGPDVVRRLTVDDGS